MKKSKRGPIVHDNFAIGTSRMINPLGAYRKPEMLAIQTAARSGPTIVTDLDRWQRVHDRALDNAHTFVCQQEADLASDMLDLASTARLYIDRLTAKAKPSTWARVKAYWDGL